jgi:hypothetical protein
MTDLGSHAPLLPADLAPAFAFSHLINAPFMNQETMRSWLEVQSR